jgi:GAF domain-containing protein
MAAQPELVTDTFVKLADTLVSSYEVLDFLNTLLSRSMDVLSASAGGVLLTNRDGDLDVLASSDERMRRLELFQLQGEEGPCIESFHTHSPVAETDLATAKERWPRFAPMALTQGYRTVYAFPMRLREQVIGALNVFHRDPGAAETADFNVAQAFTDVATIGILQHKAVSEARELAEQLQTALNSRVVLEQAKGVLAERAGLSVDDAFAGLRGYVRNHNLRLHDTAGRIVSGSLGVEQVLGAR